MKIKIILNEIEKINKFINIVSHYDSEIDLCKDRFTVNAKSVLGVYSLDLSKPVDVLIHGNDIIEIEKFKNDMEEFNINESNN